MDITFIFYIVTQLPQIIALYSVFLIGEVHIFVSLLVHTITTVAKSQT